MPTTFQFSYLGLVIHYSPDDDLTAVLFDAREIAAALKAEQPAGPGRNGAADGPPKTAGEAEARFWARYGWALVESALGRRLERPHTVEEWIAVAQTVRDRIKA